MIASIIFALPPSSRKPYIDLQGRLNLKIGTTYSYFCEAKICNMEGLHRVTNNLAELIFGLFM